MRVSAPPPAAGAGSAPTIVAGGNLGASRSQSMPVNTETWLTGTLNADHVLTLSPGVGSRLRLFGAQDGTGSRTLTVSDGTNSQVVTIPTDPSASFEVDFYSPDGSTIYINAGSGAGIPGTNGTNGAISQIQDEGSNLTVRATIDFQGAGVSAADSAGKTVVTIPGGGGGGSVATDTIWDAAGDLAVGSGADTAARLAKGANGQALTVRSGALAYSGAVDQPMPETLVAPFDPRLIAAQLVLGTNTIFAVRVIVRKTGTLHDLAAPITVTGGNCRMAVFDTGDASAGNRSRLYDSGSVATPAAGWQIISDPAIAVTAGQHLDLAMEFDNGTARVGVVNSILSGGALNSLPAAFWTAVGGLLPKLAWSNAPGSFTMPATIAEAAATAVVNAPVLIARVS